VKNETCPDSRSHSSCRHSGVPSPVPWLAALAGVARKGLRPAFVYAHADDAVFSSFFALIETGQQALDLLICAGVPKRNEAGLWDKQCGFASSVDARRRRLAEHERVCQSVGIRSIALAEVDAQYEEPTPEPAATTAALMVTALQYARTNIVLTHGWSSDHPDHRRATALAQLAGAQLMVPVVFTCDRPYYSCSARTCGSREEPPHGPRRSIALPDDVWDLKMRAVRLYSSQHAALCAAFGRGWCTRRRLGRECYRAISN
jgi:LmbE family N-acetylglucosaminyl deacetylase